MGVAVLIQLAWAFWIVLLVALLVSTVALAREGRTDPDGGRGFGRVHVPAMYALLLGTGALLLYFARIESRFGAAALMVVHGYFALMLVVQPAVMTLKRRRLDRGPATTRTPDGRAPIHDVITDTSADGREAVLLLLERGADPNAVDPLTGDTPIREAGDNPGLVRALLDAGAEMDRVQANGVTALVEYVARNQWESARILVERGARLDVANEDGLSLDYYLESWKDSVFGEHPEGWDRLRAAIAARQG